MNIHFTGETPGMPRPEATPMPRRIVKKRGTTRQRTGCLTCRQRKKRCDLGYPLCKECVRLNYVCQWEDPRTIAYEDRSKSPMKQDTQASNAPFRLCNVPDPVLFWVDDHSDSTSVVSRRHFLRYYTQTFTHLLTTNIENNSFLSVFLPMALHSPPLLTLLIAWSSSHLSLRDRSFEQVAMQNRCTALRELRSTLASDPTNVEANLAMSLVLCSLESIMADNGDAWYLHLVGAAGVISSEIFIRNSSGTSNPDNTILQCFQDAHAGRWLLRNFAYRDIVTAVARDQAPLLESYQFLQLDDARLPDSHFGLASKVLEILFHAAVLNKEINATTTASDSTETEVLFPKNTTNITIDESEGKNIQNTVVTRLLSLESRLQDWICPPSPDTSLRQLAESYRSSTLIYLYRVMRRALPEQYKELSMKATAQVAAIVENLSQMPTRSLPECTLLFPLFLAGGEATTESHMQYIRHRMLDIADSRGFKNVEVALSVLEKLWRLRIARRTLEESTPVDWLDIVRADSIYLSLS